MLGKIQKYVFNQEILMHIHTKNSKLLRKNKKLKNPNYTSEKYFNHI